MNPHDLIVPALRGETVAWPEACGEELEAAVVGAAVSHGVAVLLATMPAVERWPGDVRAALNRERRGEAAAEEIRRQDLIHLLAQLHGAGIATLLMKGALLAYAHYSSPWLRPRFDTDVLVSPSDRWRADQVLRKIGYRPGTHFSGDFVTHQFRYERPSRFEFNDVIDLHWKISNPHAFADAFAFHELAADAHAVATLGPDVRGLSPEHALILACIHRVAHHDASDRLIWLYDIHLLAGVLDAAAGERVAQVAAEKRLGSVCADGVSQAQSRFRTVVRGSWSERLRSQAEPAEPTAAFLRGNLTKIDVLVSDLRTLDNWRKRLALIREHLFPPPAYMRQAYGISNPALLPFTYLIRAFTGVGRWFRANGR